MNPINFCVICFIKAYQMLTKHREHRCMHNPSCSNYFILAYERYGFFRASFLTIYRWRSCNIENKEDIPYEHWL